VVATGIDAQTQQAVTSNNTGGQKFSSGPEPKKPFAFAAATSASKAEFTKPIPRPAHEQPARENVSTSASASRPQVEQRSGGAVRVEKASEPQVQQAVAASEAPAVRYRVSDFEQEESESRALPEMRHEVRQDVRPAAVRTQVVDSTLQETQAETRIAVGGRQAYREPPREPARNFFKRMADVGRALSARNEEAPVKPHVHERVHVVQKAIAAEPADKQQKMADEDQYLDIPAFLRRQAN
jgi:hypothetical protein